MVESTNQTEKQKKALNRAVEIAEFALKFAKPKFLERQFYNNMYHTYDEVLREKQWWQSKFAHPFPFFTTEMKSSFYYEGVFGTSAKGIWLVHPWNEFTLNSAEVATKLLKYQEENSEFVKTFYTGSKGLNIYGDWFLETFWDHQERFIQERDDFVVDFDGQVQRPVFNLRRGSLKPITEKSQPEVRTLHINSVWPDPKATNLKNARYICVRREIPFKELKREEFKTGRYINVDDLKETQMPKVPEGYYDLEPYSPFIRNSKIDSQGQTSPVDKEDPLVEIIEIHWTDTGEVETIGNRAVYLGRIIPYTNLKCAITHIKNYEEIGKFYGTSDFRAIAPHWKTINQYQSLEADNILFHFRGYTTVNRDAGPNVPEEMENLRPGSVVVVNNQGAIDHNRPDVFSPQVITSKQELINDAQRPLGLGEILSGATPSSNVRSATQQSQLANFGAKLLSQGIRNISEGLKEVGQNWIKLNYEFLDLDQTIPVLGNRGTEFIKVKPGDIPINAQLSVRLSADLEAQKDQKLQQMLQAINLAQNVPGFASSRAIKEWFRTQGTFEEPDRLFLISDEESAALTLSQFGLQGQGRSGAQRTSNIPQEPGLAGATTVPSTTQVAQGNANANEATVPGF